MLLKKLLAFFFVAIAGCCFASTVPLNPDWAFYESPFASWEETDVAKVTGTPARYGKADREVVALKDGIFLRESASGGISLLVNEFETPAADTAYLRCGANCSFMQVGLNGRMVFDGRTTFARNANGGNGSHVIRLALKKGKNVLSVKFYPSKYGFPDRKVRFYFGFAQVDETESRKALPTRENFSAIDYAATDTPKRHIDEEIIRNGVDQMTSTDFTQFDRHPGFSPAELTRIYTRYPVLEFYDRAMDKILREVPATKVERGIAVWHLYNMGYVVKTPNCCFGIDIHHRRAVELAPLLDFILVTHNHSDHYNLRLLSAMTKANKMVISNFYPAKGYQRPPAKFQLFDVTIESEETDHNATLKKFVSAYRITCGKNADAPVIYHTGDSCDPAQLHPSGKIDIHIVHPCVGLSVPEAEKMLCPKEVWISHLLEMGHCKPGIYRPVDWIFGYLDQAAIRQGGQKVVCKMPMWGEKIVVEE